MLPKPTLLAFFIAALFAMTPLESTIVPALDVAALTAGADTIVIGQIISVTDRGPTSLDLGGGPISATDFEAVLRVDRVLKGTSRAQTLTLDFTLAQMPSGMQGVVTDQYGVFFLTETQNRFRFTDPIYPALPAIRNVNLSSGTALDQVTTVLGQVFEAAQVSEWDRVSALDALGGLNSDLARDTLRHALNNSSHHVRLEAARTLVAHNDMSGLATVEDALLRSAGLSETMLSNLAGSLGGLHDPRAIPALKRLLGTNNQNITKGAAIALRQSGSPDALAPLSHLLENSDERVRYYAVVGMGEITKQDEWTPAFDEFRDHEAKYLAYWRDWAASNLPREAPR